MTKRYLSLQVAQQRKILEAASEKLERAPEILEKDIWVCQVLQTLFSISNHHPMAFKGGTSLSKVYGVIDRFSEDVDITLDYRGFDDNFDPFGEEVSRAQKNKFMKRLKCYVKDYTEKVIRPALQDMAKTLAIPNQYVIRSDDTGEKIWFDYPSVVESQDDYLKSHVLVELGGRNVIDPNEQHYITPDIADLTEDLEFPKVHATVLSPARTFWEKATLIHVECNRGRLKERSERLSRHWYDIARLAKHDIGKTAMANRTLLEDVICHKEVFFNASYANYDACLCGQLRLVPEDDDLRGLNTDYDMMNFSGMLGDDAPDFKTMIGWIREIETKINNQQ